MLAGLERHFFYFKEFSHFFFLKKNQSSTTIIKEAWASCLACNPIPQIMSFFIGSDVDGKYLESRQFNLI